MPAWPIWVIPWFLIQELWPSLHKFTGAYSSNPFLVPEFWPISSWSRLRFIYSSSSLLGSGLCLSNGKVAAPAHRTVSIGPQIKSRLGNLSREDAEAAARVARTIPPIDRRRKRKWTRFAGVTQKTLKAMTRIVETPQKEYTLCSTKSVRRNHEHDLKTSHLK